MVYWLWAISVRFCCASVLLRTLFMKTVIRNCIYYSLAWYKRILRPIKNRSFNQSINQSINQTINELIKIPLHSRIWLASDFHFERTVIVFGYFLIVQLFNKQLPSCPHWNTQQHDRVLCNHDQLMLISVMFILFIIEYYFYFYYFYFSLL